MYNAHVASHWSALARSMGTIALRDRHLQPFHVALWNTIRILRQMARDEV